MVPSPSPQNSGGKGGDGTRLPSTFLDPIGSVGQPGPGGQPGWVAGGGGGGSYSNNPPAAGGYGGGGRGGAPQPAKISGHDGPGVPGAAGTGGGGGGGAFATPYTGGDGGSGLVLIAYPVS